MTDIIEELESTLYALEFAHDDLMAYIDSANHELDKASDQADDIEASIVKLNNLCDKLMSMGGSE